MHAMSWIILISCTTAFCARGETAPAQVPCGQGGASVAPVPKPSQEKWAELLRHVSMGHEQAIKEGLTMRRGLDGGDLEDMDRALGRSASAAPRALLENAKASCLPLGQLQRIVAMLPLDTVDRPDERRRILEDRVRRMLVIVEPSLTELRDAAVVALRERLREE